jgi:hypothetical protein
MREMLTSLSVERISRGSGDDVGPFDGRLAILTRGGARIPIAAVHPLLACSISSPPQARRLSLDVQCTVFQVQTPAGEVFTLPLDEIRGFHALTPERLQKRAEARGGKDGDDQPFGLAAFTSLARSASHPAPAGSRPPGASPRSP